MYVLVGPRVVDPVAAGSILDRELDGVEYVWEPLEDLIDRDRRCIGDVGRQAILLCIPDGPDALAEIRCRIDNPRAVDTHPILN